MEVGATPWLYGKRLRSWRRRLPLARMAGRQSGRCRRAKSRRGSRGIFEKKREELLPAMNRVRTNTYFALEINWLV